MVMVPYFFNPCENITVNGPRDLMKIPKTRFRKMPLWTKKNSVFYEVKFSLQICHVICLVIILIHNRLNNPDLTF